MNHVIATKQRNQIKTHLSAGLSLACDHGTVRLRVARKAISSSNHHLVRPPNSPHHYMPSSGSRSGTRAARSGPSQQSGDNVIDISSDSDQETVAEFQPTSVRRHLEAIQQVGCHLRDILTCLEYRESSRQSVAYRCRSVNKSGRKGSKRCETTLSL